MAEIIDMPGVTYGGVPPDKVLEAAMGKMEDVVVVGVPKKEGQGLYFASSTGDGKVVLWLIEGCKMALFDANRIATEDYE